MCGRFAVTLPTDAMAQLFEATPANDLPDVPNYNVCPTTSVHAVIQADGRKLVSIRWGFLPHWYKSLNDGPLLINARSETIAQKPAFRAACRERRCLLIATGFYEWTRDGDTRLPWYITRNDGDPIIFAGIWQDWSNGEDHLRSCAIVTTAANSPMSTIHHRMPVILPQKTVGFWLGEAGKGAARLMKPAPDDALIWHRVDNRVNSNKAKGPSLIDKI